MTGSDFWSRRKAQVEDEARQDLAQAEAERAAQLEAELEARSDDDLLQEAGLPDPDHLTDSDQVQEFLRSNLPQRLKTRALRRLWRLNPIFANLDGLVDYGEDFTDAATVVEGMQTVYQVGKGMLSRFEELAEAETAEEDAPSDEGPIDQAPLNEVAADHNPAPEQADRVAQKQDDFNAAQNETCAQGTDQDGIAQNGDLDTYDDVAPAPRARRMRFRYAGLASEISKDIHP